MEYKLNGKISLKDFIQFNKNHKRHGPALTLRLAAYSLLIVFTAVVFLLSFNFVKSYLLNLSALELVKVFSPFILLLIFLILLHTVGMPLIYKSQYNANKDLQESFNITINDRCISIRTDNGNTVLTKEMINKVYYDKNSIYLYTGQNTAYILKKHYLENENDFGDLVKLIKENYDKSGEKTHA
jgi:hypothetical protein